MSGLRLKILLQILFLILPIFCFSQSKENLFLWSTVDRLGYDQFALGAPLMETEHYIGHGSRTILEGYIFTGIDYSYQQINKEITFTVNSFMMPDKSWISDTTNKQTLEHEQAHFDITEIYSRKMKMELSTALSKKAADKIYNKLFHELQDEQKKFDTAHHGEIGVEPEWKKRIFDQLEYLKKWSTPIVNCQLK